jgi:hypothetical protein
MKDFGKIDELLNLAEDGEGTPRWAQVSNQARNLITFARTVRDQTSKDKDIKEFKKYAFGMMKQGTQLLMSLGYRSFARKLDVQIEKYEAMPEPRVPPEEEPEEEPKEKPGEKPEEEPKK